MSTATNPLFSSVLPGGNNPTGNMLSLMSLSNTPGLNPLLPNVNLSTNSAGRTNAYDIVPTARPAGSTAPGFSANTGPYSTTGGSPITGGPGGNAAGAITGSVDPAYWDKMYKDLRGTYGSGVAQAITQFLKGGAGYNQQAINNLLASLQPGIERGQEDIMSQFSVLGNRFGSGAQIGLGDYLSQVNLNEGQLVSQMYEQAVNNYIDVLMGTSSTQAQANMNKPSIFDTILGALGIGGKAAGGLSSAITAGNPGADTSILDAIAGAAAF